MKQPTNAVLEERLKNIIEAQIKSDQKASEFQKEVFSSLKEIQIQTAKTNGRVNQHDEDLERLESKLNGTEFFRGKATVYFWFMGITIAGIVGAFIKSLFI